MGTGGLTAAQLGEALAQLQVAPLGQVRGAGAGNGEGELEQREWRWQGQLGFGGNGKLCPWGGDKVEGAVMGGGELHPAARTWRQRADARARSLAEGGRRH